MLKARATTGPVSWKRWKGPLGAGIESHSNGHHHHHNHHNHQHHHSPHNHHSGGGSSGGGGVLQNGRTGGGGIRVGSAFQATIPEFSPEQTWHCLPDKHSVAQPNPSLPPACARGILVMPRERTRDRDREDVPVWSPHHSIPEEQLDEYLSVAKEVHGYSTEQHWGLLLWHAHNIERSLADMPNFAPDADEWGETERALFEQAYGFHGKSFHLIQQMLPGKSIGSLVRHYYTWKQTRTRTSVMDREERRQASRRAQLHSDEELDGAQEEEDEEDNASDSDYHPYKKMKRERRDGPPASPPPRHRAHRAHHHHHHHSGRDRRHPPRHMYLEQSDLQVVVAACCPPASDS
uniref:REST corepressor 1 n=1 Tax=Petromyzon marinus TaxID=7757 RepID=S4RP21_PETMA